MTAPDAKPNPLHADHPALILARGGLHSTNHTPNDALPFRTLHNVDIQNVRRARPGPCGPGGAMHDYVPFYFGQLSPMLLRSKSSSGTTPQATATARSRMSKSSFSRVPPMKPRLSSPVTLTRISASDRVSRYPRCQSATRRKGVGQPDCHILYRLSFGSGHPLRGQLHPDQEPAPTRAKTRFRGLSKPPHLKSHFHKCHIAHVLQGA